MEKIVALQLCKVADRLKERSITLKWDPAVVRHLAREGYDPAGKVSETPDPARRRRPVWPGDSGEQTPERQRPCFSQVLRLARILDPLRAAMIYGRRQRNRLVEFQIKTGRFFGDGYKIRYVHYHIA